MNDKIEPSEIDRERGAMASIDELAHVGQKKSIGRGSGMPAVEVKGEVGVDHALVDKPTREPKATPKTMSDTSSIISDLEITRSEANIPAILPTRIKPTTVLSFMVVMLRQILERFSEEEVSNLFTEAECLMLLSKDTNDHIRVALFNSRIMSRILAFSGREGNHVMDYIAALETKNGLAEYSLKLTKIVIPFMLEYDVLKNK